MLFDFEPSGINDTYLRLTRNGIGCIMAPAGAWNGLLRLNYVIAGNPGGREAFLIFRALDVGFDDGRFYWKGRAAPVLATGAMVDVLLERGLASETEAERLLAGGSAGGGGGDDEALMLRAALGGSTFTPIYEDTAPGGGTPRVTGYALRTLGGTDVHVLRVRNGLPALDPKARAALKRQVEAA